MKIAIDIWATLGAQQREALLQRPAVAQDATIRNEALNICTAVREQGDAAVRELTQKLDGCSLTSLQVTEQEIEDAFAQLSDSQLAAIDLAIKNIQTFHKPQLTTDIRVETMPGVVCERISRPIESVGLYVPAGTAPLPSAAIMLAVPAITAGCRHIVLCTPPRPDGLADPSVLVAAYRAGIREMYKVGGAQAIAALAYGTESVPKVSKIFGPGNAWVTSAKSIVSADSNGAAIDMPAGPSEVLVIGDSNASPEFIAADLLSQAEHGVDSQVVFVTDNAALAQEVRQETLAQLTLLSRESIAKRALENSRFIVVDNLEQAVEISNQYAPEHLILQVDEPREMLSRITNAGSVFLGRWTPESVGDYCSGTNHVLPTYGYAKAYSGLGVDQFLRQMTVQELSESGLEQLGDAVVSLAGLEGLDAHAAAVTRRLGRHS
jgi:histidinol dehydrogenase